MVDSADQIDPAWLSGKKMAGVTAGASAPEVLVKEVIARLEQLGAESVKNLQGVEENVVFPLPKNLTSTAQP
jgi:4-hydroxy-3-methylbut-2-enyl diphosphate reductase